MSDYLTVKTKLREFIVSNISQILTSDKVFFATERITAPQYPFIQITELSNSEDLKSGRNQPLEHKLEVTQYKECVFTIAIYGLSETDLSTEKDTFRKEINNIRNAFEFAKYTQVLGRYFAIKSMTDLRPLSTNNETGFTYRYEFDIKCGYNEVITNQMKLSQGVIIELEENNIHEKINKENLNV